MKNHHREVPVVVQRNAKQIYIYNSHEGCLFSAMSFLKEIALQNQSIFRHVNNDLWFHCLVLCPCS